MARDFDVVPVQTPADRRAFVGFQYEHYRHDPLWVPYLHSERLEFTDPARCPFFEHAEVALFRAVRRGRTIGTIAAIRNDAHNEFHGEKPGSGASLTWSKSTRWPRPSSIPPATGAGRRGSIPCAGR